MIDDGHHPKRAGVDGDALAHRRPGAEQGACRVDVQCNGIRLCQCGLQVALGTAAVFLATLNVVGGFTVTDRMLGMFKAKPAAKKTDEVAK